METTVEMVKCACSDCVCVVGTAKAIKRDGRFYCSDACADHHPDGAGCHHAGCECHG
ncbi:metallothionein [Sabulicella rubraurantiaca]|uniref:metallothionein n=1 Tax=Sabulicella rubraurantiaca TaxID=2811429 RepID=UPI001A96E6A8|nr:metallothionein [Sabulicella rubraurantiaca]